MLPIIQELRGIDFNNINAKVFEIIIGAILSLSGTVTTQVPVPDRGDGRKGFIDILYTTNDGREIAIEIDRKSPRKKSIFKVSNYGADEAYVILRSPFTIIKIT